MATEPWYQEQKRMVGKRLLPMVSGQISMQQTGDVMSAAA
jgi:hypothetical protein